MSRSAIPGSTFRQACEKCGLESREPQPYVSIPISVTLRDWERANALVPEVLSWLQVRGHAPASAPFFRYWTVGDLDVPFDLEIGFPVQDVVPGDGRVRAGEIPAGTYPVKDQTVC